MNNNNIKIACDQHKLQGLAKEATPNTAYAVTENTLLLTNIKNINEISYNTLILDRHQGWVLSPFTTTSLLNRHTKTDALHVFLMRGIRKLLNPKTFEPKITQKQLFVRTKRHPADWINLAEIQEVWDSSAFDISLKFKDFQPTITIENNRRKLKDSIHESYLIGSILELQYRANYNLTTTNLKDYLDIERDPFFEQDKIFAQCIVEFVSRIGYNDKPFINELKCLVNKYSRLSND